MKQQLKETVVYEPNDDVRVTVNNKPALDKQSGGLVFEQTVTVKVILGWKPEKLSFINADELRAFLDDIDLEDPQTELALEGSR